MRWNLLSQEREPWREKSMGLKTPTALLETALERKVGDQRRVTCQTVPPPPLQNVENVQA
jgi:hypothetical protein